MRRSTALAATAIAAVTTIALGVGAAQAWHVEAPPAPSAAATTEPEAHASEPVPAADQRPTVTAPQPDSTRSAEPTPEVVASAEPAALPTRLEVPQIGIDTDLEQLGLLDDGSLATPVDTDLAGWFEGGPRPGAVGPAVIAGHVSWNGDPSVFFRLGELAPGDVLTVHRQDGTAVDFEVTRLEQHAKNEFPTVSVYANTDRPELRLITCGGEFDRSTGHFDDNVIVFAREVEG